MRPFASRAFPAPALPQPSLLPAGPVLLSFHSTPGGFPQRGTPPSREPRQAVLAAPRADPTAPQTPHGHQEGFPGALLLSMRLTTVGPCGL